MDFTFTPEQEALRDTVRRFAETELAPLVREADDTENVEIGGSGRNSSRGRRAQGDTVLSRLCCGGPDAAVSCTKSHVNCSKYAGGGGGCTPEPERIFHVWSVPSALFDRPGH